MRLNAAALLAPPALLLAGAIAAQGSGTANVRHAMTDEINPATLVIWDVGNKAMNDAGGIDPKLMTADNWAKLSQAAASLSAAGSKLESAQAIVVATPSNMPDSASEGASVAEIQSYIDARPDAFRRAAGELKALGDELSQAAAQRDAAAAGDLVARLDGVCEGCHSIFWYPEQ